MITSRRQAALLKPQERMVRPITTNLVPKDVGPKVLAQENGCMEQWRQRPGTGLLNASTADTWGCIIPWWRVSYALRGV